MKYKKYRDLNIKPNQINFQNINILKVINYMPAGNDVLECTILYNNCVVEAFFKIERSRMADFASEIYNLNYLNNDLDYNKIPVIYEYGNINDKYYIVLEKLNGKILSEIINNNSKNKNEYLEKYGKELGIIHKINPDNFNIAKQRIINEIPKIKNMVYDTVQTIREIKYFNQGKIL